MTKDEAIKAKLEIISKIINNPNRLPEFTLNDSQKDSLLRTNKLNLDKDLLDDISAYIMYTNLLINILDRLIQVVKTKNNVYGLHLPHHEDLDNLINMSLESFTKYMCSLKPSIAVKTFGSPLTLSIFTPEKINEIVLNVIKSYNSLGETKIEDFGESVVNAATEIIKNACNNKGGYNE